MCRSVLIQNYFGESAAQDCGICDYCIEKSDRGLRVTYDEKIRESLFKLIHGRGKKVSEILHPVPELEKDHWIQVIREMLETEELYYDENGLLYVAGEHND